MKRLFVVGIDGMCLPIWDRLIRDGSIPFLAQTVQTTRPLASTSPPHSAPSWTSMSTGLNPGRHGVLDFWQRHSTANPTTPNRQLFTNSGKASFWEVADQQGAKVGIFNYPLSYPPRQVNGFWISGLNTPPNSTDYVYPPELANRLENYVIDVDIIGDGRHRSANDSKHRITALTAVTDLLRNHIRTGLLVLQSPAARDVNLYFFVLTATDRFLHLFFDLMSDSAISDNQQLSDKIQEFWKTLDDGIRQWVDAAQPDTVMVVSDHGFAQYPIAAFNFTKWLQDCRLIPKSGKQLDIGWIARRMSRSTVVKTAIQRMLPSSLQKSIRRATQSSSEQYYRTSSLWIPEVIYGNMLGLTLNQTTKNPDDSQAIINELYTAVVRNAEQLHDAQGLQVIKSVQHARDIWWGEYTNRFPDLVINLDPRYGGSTGSTDARLFIPANSIRRGDHDPYGLVGFSESYADESTTSAHLSVWDVPAIALHLLGAEIPRYFDGIVPGWIPRSPHYSDNYSAADSTRRQYTQAEEEAITRRLKGLGYLE